MNINFNYFLYFVFIVYDSIGFGRPCTSSTTYLVHVSQRSHLCWGFWFFPPFHHWNRSEKTFPRKERRLLFHPRCLQEEKQSKKQTREVISTLNLFLYSWNLLRSVYHWSFSWVIFIFHWSFVNARRRHQAGNSILANR